MPNQLKTGTLELDEFMTFLVLDTTEMKWLNKQI